MKKVLMIGVLALTTIGCGGGGDTMFGAVGDMAMKGRNAMRDTIPTTVQALESDGGNFRYYEFDAPKNDAWSCWGAAGTQKGFGGCYPKAQKYLNKQ